MEIIADLQLHSRFSRACSKNITLNKLEEYARIKGLDLLSTADFQHPIWNKEIKKTLEEDENGVLWSKNKFPFIWGTEISLMYGDNGRRAVHLLVYAPDGDVADQIIDILGKKGRLDYDGRPIFGISCPEFVELMKEIDEKIEIIPSHCMTSFFGIFGSKSGFDSLKECFKDKVNKIYAIESGMSANPGMLWRLKENVNIVSFSDAHSYWPYRLGREATIFDLNELSYDNIINAIRTGNGLKKTIEVYPNYGKYHIDGHRMCDFFCDYKRSLELNKICPKCGKELTIGVEYRIEELAKEKEGYKPENAKDFIEIIPLQEVIAAVYDIKQLNGKKIWDVYNKLIKEFGNEFNILLNVSFDDLKKIVDERLANIVIKNRDGELRINPGADGVYGVVMLNKNEKIISQTRLNQF
ncbi:DNA helicase UvrD [Candidatus Woesearchaeota archaeon]|nr:DNA helicase UvrD [Candidatus Woesearchaeota archaeon]